MATPVMLDFSKMQPLPKAQGGVTLDFSKAQPILGATAQPNSIPGLDGPLPGVPSATPSREQMASQMGYVTSPSEITGGAWEGIKSLVNPKTYTGMAKQVNETLPKYSNVGGIPLPIPNGDQMQSGADQLQALKDRPARVVSSLVAPALLTAGINKALPKIAPPVLEYAGEKLQRGGEGIINKNVLGVRKADIKRGANPGQGYFQAGFGPSASMHSIAQKAAAGIDTTGDAIGSAIDNGVGNGVVIPGSEVAGAVYSPASSAREVLNGPFGPGSEALDRRMEGFNGKIQTEMDPRQVFNLKRGVAKNISWSDPTAIGVKQVGQQITGGLSGVLSNHVPELEPLNSQYQNLTSLENVAGDRAATGQRSLTSMAAKAGFGLGSAAIGYSHSPVAGAALGLGALALDSIPVKTSLASAMYYGGKGAVALGNGIKGLYAPNPATVPATFAFDRKPLQLESSVPANAGFGAEPDSGSFPSRSPFTPPAPRSPLALPASTSAGVTQPMIGVKAPAPYPQLAADFARNRTVPTKFNGPPSNPFGIPKGYLNPPKTRVKGGSSGAGR